MKHSIKIINTDKYNWEARKMLVAETVADLLRKDKHVILVTSHADSQFATDMKVNVGSRTSRLHLMYTDEATSTLKMPNIDTDELVYVVDVVNELTSDDLISCCKNVVVFSQRSKIGFTGTISTVYSADVNTSISRAIQQAKVLINEGKRVIYFTTHLKVGKVKDDIEEDLEELEDNIVVISSSNVELHMRNQSSSDENTVIIAEGIKIGDGVINVANDIKLFLLETDSNTETRFVVAQAIDYTEKCDGYAFTNYRSVQAETANDAIDKYVQNMGCGYSFVMCLGTVNSDKYEKID